MFFFSHLKNFLLWKGGAEIVEINKYLILLEYACALQATIMQLFGIDFQGSFSLFLIFYSIVGVGSGEEIQNYKKGCNLMLYLIESVLTEKDGKLKSISLYCLVKQIYDSWQLTQKVKWQ